jgi:hypothetical protein
VLGRVQSTERWANNSNAADFATWLQVDCVLATFSDPPGNAQALVTGPLRVEGFGMSRAECPQGMGTTDDASQSRVCCMSWW